jgi:hypothetical protein
MPNRPVNQNRSPLCRVITDFHSPSQLQLARFDFLGAAFSAVLAALLVEGVRLILSR